MQIFLNFIIQQSHFLLPVAHQTDRILQKWVTVESIFIWKNEQNTANFTYRIKTLHESSQSSLFYTEVHLLHEVI